jgi:hypothetical protein
LRPILVLALVPIVIAAAQDPESRPQAPSAESQLVLANQAAAKDDYETATQLAKAALKLAQGSQDSGWEKRIRLRLEELEQLAAKYKDYQSAMATLASNPADPEGNLVAGKYRCFVKGDWARGLPMLAASGDAEYAGLAAEELKEITEPAAQVKQGDGWWELAEKRHWAPQKQLRLHAAYWYRKAIPQLTGLMREKVQQRVTQAAEAETETAGGLIAGLKNPFAGRTALAKQSLLAAGGGTAESERAVAAALAWLARHQNQDGSWSIDYHARCRGPGCTGPGSCDAPGAATAFGLLPFLAAGQTHETRGPYQNNIRNGFYWLVGHQKPTGDLSVTGGQTQMYSHGLATITLCEAYGMTHDRHLEAPAKAALHFIEVGQDQQTGGWWYTHRQPGGDTSVFGWQFMALKSGMMARLAPSHACFDLAKKWLDSVGKGAAKGLFSYMPDREASDTMTAVGLLGTQYLGANSGDPRIAEGEKFLMANLPNAANGKVYYWYYATQVMHNLPGPDWDQWNRQMRTVLIKTQCGDTGCANGSWDPQQGMPEWAAQGGRLMMTSLAALTLEIYYRYPPLSPQGKQR